MNRNLEQNQISETTTTNSTFNKYISLKRDHCQDCSGSTCIYEDLIAPEKDSSDLQILERLPMHSIHVSPKSSLAYPGYSDLRSGVNSTICATQPRQSDKCQHHIRTASCSASISCDRHGILRRPITSTFKHSDPDRNGQGRLFTGPADNDLAGLHDALTTHVEDSAGLSLSFFFQLAA